MAKKQVPSISPRSIDSNGDAPLYDQVTALIRRKIETGQLNRGEKIPSLRALSQDLGLAYATVARGVRVLVEQGVLEASAGRGGTRVATGQRVRRNAIGIIAGMSYEHLMNQTRYYRQFLLLLQSRLTDSGKTVVFRRWDREKPLTSEFDHLSLVDAIVLFDMKQADIPAIQGVRRMGVPVVNIGDHLEDARVPYVHRDNFSDCYNATQHLIAQGHRHIVHVEMVSQRDPNPSSRKTEGYLKAMADAGLTASPAWSICANGQQAAEALLKLSPQPTAVLITPNAYFFADFYNKLHGTALEPGKKLQVCVSDDNLWNLLSGYRIPRIVIEQPIDDMVSRSIEMLENMLADASHHPGGTMQPSRIVHYASDGSITRIIQP